MLTGTSAFIATAYEIDGTIDGLRVEDIEETDLISYGQLWCDLLDDLHVPELTTAEFMAAKELTRDGTADTQAQRELQLAAENYLCPEHAG